MNISEEYLTRIEAASICKCSTKTIDNMRNGVNGVKLDCIKNGRIILIARSSIDKYMIEIKKHTFINQRYDEI